MNANDNIVDTTSPEFIARAVRSHHALVSALEKLIDRFRIKNDDDATVVAFAYIVIYNATVLK